MFTPWVGKNYYNSPFRTLILGESHYGEAHLEHGYQLEQKTILCIQQQIDDVWRSSFYTKVASTLLGYRPTLSDKRVFWESVAYHNLITEPLIGPRRPPSHEQWEASIVTLPSVLNKLQPDYCVCLGFRMWPHLRETLDFMPMGLAADAGECGVVFSKTHKCALHGIKHPSGRGYSSSFWHDRVSEIQAKLKDNKTQHHKSDRAGGLEA